MPFTKKGQPEEVEALVDTLTIEGTTLNDPQLSPLSNCDLQQLAELSQELHLSNEMENQSEETEMMDVQEEMETIESEEIVVQPEIGAQEVEIVTERPASPEEILPDIKSNSKATVPPLRPLTIAPKPPKVPVQFKPVSGQQLLLVQGTGAGQTIKLLSPQGQELNLANISMGRPLTLKPAIKTISTPTSLAVYQTQPTQVLMKKVIAPANKTVIPRTAIGGKQGHIMVVKKSEPQTKIVQSHQGSITLPSATKTITLQQAQEMGLLAGAKIVPQTGTTKHTVLLNKSPGKAIKIVPQMKLPTKILPAPQTNAANKVTQRIILKPTTANQPVLSASQLIQVQQPIASGQVHQINIPGKGVQYIKFVTASSAETSTSTSNSTLSTKTVLQSPLQTVSTGTSVKPANVVLSEIKTLSNANTISPKPIKPAVSVRPSSMQISSSGGSQVVMVPTAYIPQPKVAIPMRSTQSKPSQTETATPAADAGLESNGMRPRKPCNCTKSQCLKLYCDCFANGEFCHLCNCMNCYNNIENEEHRQRAIKNCLERNPHAFRPKIGKAKDNTGEVAIRKHTKGCNCKRSGCLKNYCECYEAKIACSSNCKCMGCRNIEDSMDKKSIRPQIVADSLISNSGPAPASKMNLTSKDVVQFRPRRQSNSKQAFNYITNEVIEATSQCLLALTDNAETDSQNEEVTKQQIIEEFGRCLMEIISCSVAYSNNNPN